jgi:hypothetical protein
MPRRKEAEELLFSGFVLLSVFTSQWAWEHYNVILVVPFAILANEVAKRAQRGAKGPVLVASTLGLGLALPALRVPIHEKQIAQAAVRAGDMSSHWKLHLYEALNSAPLVLLLAVAATLAIARFREEQGTSPVETGTEGGRPISS